MDDLLIKYVLGEATGEEAAKVDRWLEADAANRRRYEQYKTLWAVARRTAAEESERSGRLMPENWVRTAPERRVRLAGTGWLRLAAVVIGVLLLGAGGYWMLMPHRKVAGPDAVPVQMDPVSAIEVPHAVKLAGARPMRDTLPDGTLVTLNRGASLEIVGGTVERGLTVRLRGEGFFSVTHDPARAFVVQFGAVTIKVLGTSFELNGDGQDSMELVVETGAVRVEDRMTLHAGERLTVTGGGLWKIGPNGDHLYGYYLGRPLVCDSIPLRRLVEVLNREDDLTILLGRKELGDLPLTTVFRGESPERILEVVALTFNLSIVRRGSTIILQ
jgi:transmembrane sensor